MKPFCEIGPVSIYQGDVREVLPELAAESVNCVVTSPPYWGLRDYGTAKWEGGEGECDHSTPRSRGDDIRYGDKQGTSAGSRPNTQTQCKCGAIRIDSQLGLERTPDEYISNMVALFREVKRVLRSDGTLWLNMGDSYCSTDKWGGGSLENTGKQTVASDGSVPAWEATRRRKEPLAGIKPKDLCGIPWMLAFALRADGWYLRQDIIWAKPNPMPESVTDRCIKAHEYIFLLSKSERYFYDAEVIKEASVTNDNRRPYGSEGAWALDGRPDEQRHGGEPRSFKGSKFNKGKTATHQLGRASDQPRKVKIPGGWDRGEGAHGTIHRAGRTSAEYQDAVVSENRNKRSVWTVSTAPFPEAHFATFPAELIKPCILAGCPAGGTVLDPFFGSGTTGLVARANGCKCIGVELNPEYIEIAARRLNQHVLNFAEVPA